MPVWVNPVKTWAFNDELTEALMNQEFRDRFLVLFQNQAALGGRLFSGVRLSTAHDFDIAHKTVLLSGADFIAFDDGSAVSGLTSRTVDITAAGAGGLDTGAEQASTFYEIYAIYNPSSGITSLMLHRAKNYFLDEQYDADDATILIRNVTNTRTALGQGFQVSNTGYVDFVDVELIKNGSPSGVMQAEIHSDAAGLPSGTVLATSDKLNAADGNTSSQFIRFIFRTPVSLTAATQYHLVLTGSWTPSDSVYIAWRCDTSAASYANGTRTQLESGTWNNTGTTAHDFSFKIYVRQNDAAVTMPSGYTGKCLIGYVYNDGSSNFDAFQAIDKRITPLENQFPWVTTAAAVPTLCDLSAFVPPVPVTIWLVPDPLAAGIVWSTPLPGGFYSNVASGLWRDHGAVGVSVGQYRVVSINTEAQAFYVVDDNGTANIQLDSWEW